jgi:hypothetical protein
MLEAGPSDLRCTECSCEITIEQYRRKIPRCDDCEVDALMRAVRDLESGQAA